MNFGELKSELSARDFSHLSTARLGQYINWARAELDDLFLWPYREKSSIGIAPLAVADLGYIENVTNQSQGDVEIRPLSYEALTTRYGDLTTEGTPRYYYVGWPSGSPVVATYPVSGDIVAVQYWKVTPDLGADGDTPLAPTRFHRVYLDIAQQMATRDLRDKDAWRRAEAMQPAIDRSVAKMVDALFQQAPTPRYVFVSGGEGL